MVSSSELRHRWATLVAAAAGAAALLASASTGCGARSSVELEREKAQIATSTGAGGASSTATSGGGTGPFGGSGGGGPDGGAPCAPQDARADGPCAAIVPGVAWDGSSCRPLGSGCDCAGADCAFVYDSVASCVEARRECYGAHCEPDVVASDSCATCPEGSALGAFWDGQRCFELWGCACAGEGCAAGLSSSEECEAVHALCDGARCLATAGQWFPAAAGFCGFRCGGPLPANCESPIAGCHCLAGQSFVSGLGCSADESCSAEERCVLTGGEWHPESECYCGFICGEPGICGACLDSCDCGPHRNFSPERGCEPDPACGVVESAAICAATGGVWWSCEPGEPCSCGHPYCGEPNLVDPCVMPSCDCGPSANYEEYVGCRLDAGCWQGAEGDHCRGAGSGGSSCRAGLACCPTCGIYAGCADCVAPCCPSDPSCMEDGCGPPPP